MKAKIQSFRPTIGNLILMEGVLRQAIRNGYQKRNTGCLPVFNRWYREDVREAIHALRMIQKTEAAVNVD